MRKERRWKKVLSALMLTAAMGITAVGCGTSGGNTGSQPQGDWCYGYTWNIKSAFDGWR